MSFEDAKVGDKFIHHGGSISRHEVMVCVRTSKTRLWCAVNPESKMPLQFSKKTGYLVGRGHWSTAGLWPYSEEEGQRLKDEKEMRALRCYFRDWANSRPWKEWDLKKLREVYVMMQNDFEPREN